MAKTKTAKWDASEYLDSEKRITAYLNAVFEDNGDEPALIAKARGMTQLARKTKMSRTALYTALSSEGNPEFATIIKVANGSGIKFRVT